MADAYVFKVTAVEETPSYTHVEGEDMALIPRRISVDVDAGRRIAVGNKMTVRVEFQAQDAEVDVVEESDEPGKS